MLCYYLRFLFQIPVIADLPVGKNLQDHVGTFLSFHMRSEIPRVKEKITDPENIVHYVLNRTGNVPYCTEIKIYSVFLLTVIFITI